MRVGFRGRGLRVLTARGHRMGADLNFDRTWAWDGRGLKFPTLVKAKRKM